MCRKQVDNNEQLSIMVGCFELFFCQAVYAIPSLPRDDISSVELRPWCFYALE